MIAISQHDINERWSLAPGDIQDALFSSTTEDVLYGFFENTILTKPQYRALQRVCMLIFLGFVNSKELFSLLQGEVGVDAKLALAIYQQVDRDLFAPIRVSIESFRRSMQDVPRPEMDTMQLEEKLVITDPLAHLDADVSLNLKKEEGQQPVSHDTIPAEPILGDEVAPLVLRQNVPLPPSPPPTPLPTGSISMDTVPVPSPVPVPPPTTPPVSPEEMPFILHAEGEAKPVAHQTSSQTYRPMSYGSFMGSFKTAFSQPRQDPASRARVEIPLQPFPERDASSSILRQQVPSSSPDAPIATAPSQRIPVTVKKYGASDSATEEKAKVVNYTGFNTPLS